MQKRELFSHSALSMVIVGNTTMIHFLLGMDAFCVFYTTPVHADRPGFQLARSGYSAERLRLLLPCQSQTTLAAMAISGMIDTELYKKNEISVFFDIGTNGELVIEIKNSFSAAQARDQRPRGGVVRTGMRADIGAVDEVKMDGNIYVQDKGMET